MRFRHLFLVVGSFLVISLLLLSDPDSALISELPFGASTLTVLTILVSSVLYIGLLHLARKALVDYIDLEQFFRKAIQTPEGSGLAIIGVGLIMVSISLVILAAVG